MNPRKSLESGRPWSSVTRKPSTSRFAWLTEMGELIASRHDVYLVVTATQDGVTIHRPEEVSVTTH